MSRGRSSDDVNSIALNWLRNSSAWADIRSMYSFAVLIIKSFHWAKIGNIFETCKLLGKFFGVGGFGEKME